MARSLHIFCHGLGDTVMFSAVLRHLRKHRPLEQQIVIADEGRRTALDGLATTFTDEPQLLKAVLEAGYGIGQTRPGILSTVAQEIASHVPDIDVAYEHVWPECPVSYKDSPSTKTVWCLREVFGIEPEQELLQYFIAISPDKRQMVDTYVNGLPDKLAVIHYEGNTSSQAKSLSIGDVREMCAFLVARKITPVILDWSMKHPLSDGKRIFHPGCNHELWFSARTGCAQVIAALMERAAVTICIDSGPGKVALATKTTPALQVWRHMHPIHYCDYAPHAFHLVPTTHIHSIRGVDKSFGLDFFNANYRYAVYQENQLGRIAGEFAWKLANGIPLDTKDDDDSVKVMGPKAPVYGPSGLTRIGKPFVVGIPTLNRGDLLDRCLESIQASTVKPQRIIVINNGLLLNAWSRFRDPKVEVIDPQRNLGVAASWNLLHKLAAPLPLILLNDDVEVEPATFARMLGCGVPLVCAAGWSAFLQDESVWKTVGDYDENFYPAYHEDGDYRWRCQLKGITPFEMDAGVKHSPSQTRKRFTPEEDVAFMAKWQEGHEYYQQKWGGLPGREIFERPYNGKTP